jgi:hypothetical protein
LRWLSALPLPGGKRSMSRRLLYVALVTSALAGVVLARALPAALKAASVAAIWSHPAAGDEVPAEYRLVTLPAGAILQVRLDAALGSDISRIEQPVPAHVGSTLTIDGVSVIPAGSPVMESVVNVRRPGRLKGLAHIALRFERLMVGDTSYALRAQPAAWTAAPSTEKDALQIGIPAAGGAILGGIVAGRRGAIVGGAVGGGTGTAYVASTRGREIHLKPGALVLVRLADPLTIRVRMEL